MSMTDDLLQRIDVQKREYDQTIWPPATKEAIDRVGRYRRDILHAELPARHVGSLWRNDRLNFNGSSIKGATEHEKPFLGGCIEVNAPMADLPSRFVGYGETDHTLYAQKRTSGPWVALDVPSLDVPALDVPALDVIDEFESVDGMLAHILRAAYDE